MDRIFVKRIAMNMIMQKLEYIKSIKVEEFFYILPKVKDLSNIVIYRKVLTYYHKFGIYENISIS